MRLMVFQDSQILQLGFLYNLILLTSGRKLTEGEKKMFQYFPQIAGTLGIGHL